MAGYQGYSKSNSAIEAESDYKFTITLLCKIFGLHPVILRELIEPCEWHHTSKRFNETDYYDARDCIRSRILRKISIKNPKSNHLKARQEVRLILLEELKNLHESNLIDREREIERRHDRLFLSKSQFKGLLEAGRVAGKKTDGNCASHLAFEFYSKGSTLLSHSPDYMIQHWQRKCPNLLRKCKAAIDFLKEQKK